MKTKNKRTQSEKMSEGVVLGDGGGDVNISSIGDITIPSAVDCLGTPDNVLSVQVRKKDATSIELPVLRNTPATTTASAKEHTSAQQQVIISTQ